MRYLKLFFAFFIFSVTTMAQTRLAGYVVEINSGKQKVPGYSIRSVGAHNITTTIHGQFTLVFAFAQPGKPVLIAAKKDGWQVVNPKELNTVLLENADEAPMKITVCKAGYLEKARKEYYEITDSYITKEYDKRLRSINREKEGWKKEVAKLEEQLQLLNKQISEMADEFSITNLDDLNETERKAVKLFKSGYIDSSIKLRESLHSGDKIKNAITTKKQLDSVIAVNENNLKQLAKEYILTFDFAQAEKTYEELAMADTTNSGNAFGFAYFLAKQNKHDKAIQWFELCLRIAKIVAKTNPVIYESGVASTQNNLGILYKEKNNYPAAESAYLEALQIYKRLAKIDVAAFQPLEAMTQINLGALYRKKKNFAASESAYLEALEINARLAKANPPAWEPALANTLNNLGVLYYDRKNYPAAESAYLKVREIRKRLAKTKHVIDDPDVAEIQNNLGILYLEKNNYPAAESALLEALEIRKRLAKKNPPTYEPAFATSLANLGALYSNKKNYIAAESAYLKALEIRKRLTITNPTTYEPDLATIQNNLGVLYSHIKKYTAAESAYRGALEIRRRLATINMVTYEPNVAETQFNFGNLYYESKNYTAAESAFREALEIYKRLAKTNPAIYEPDVAKAQNSFGNLYIDKENYQDAEQAYLEALEIFKRLAKTDSAAYEPEVAMTQFNLGNLFTEMKNYPPAEPAYLEALEIYKRLVKISPAIYEPDVIATKANLQDLYLRRKLKKIEELQQKVSDTTVNSAKINLSNEIIREYYSLINNGDSILADKLGSSYGNLAWLQLLEKQFANAEQSAREALNPQTFKKNKGYDSSVLWVNTNLALALLFQGKYDEAKKIYIVLKDKPYDDSASYKMTFLADLDALEKAGIKHKDVEKIRTLLIK